MFFVRIPDVVDRSSSVLTDIACFRTSGCRTVLTARVSSGFSTITNCDNTKRSFLSLYNAHARCQPTNHNSSHQRTMLPLLPAVYFGFLPDLFLLRDNWIVAIRPRCRQFDFIVFFCCCFEWQPGFKCQLAEFSGD